MADIKMKVTWEKTEGNLGVLEIEVDAQRMDRAVNQVYRKIAHKVDVPGFRKGKVPLSLFAKRYGIDSLYQDTAETLVSETLHEAVEKATEEGGLSFVSQPEIEVEQVESGKPFIYKATFVLKPEVTLGDYQTIEVPEKDFSVTPEKLQEALDKEREKLARFETSGEDSTVQEGDEVTLDYEGSVNGEARDGMKDEGAHLTIGSQSFIPGFEDQMIGMKIGEERELEVTFPEEYHAKELAGEKAIFKVIVRDIKKKVLPELDDEFAQDVSEYDTLEEFKSHLEEELQEQLKKEEEKYIRQSVLEQLSERSQVEVPEKMIDEELDRRLERFKQSLKGVNQTDESFWNGFVGQLRNDWRGDVEKQLREQLVLEAVGLAEKVEVTPEDIEEEFSKSSKELEEAAANFGVSVDQVKESATESVKERLFIKKTLDLLVSKRVVKA